LAVLKTLTTGVQNVPFSANADDRTTIRAAEAFAYHSARISSTPELYQPEVLARIRSGADVSAVAYIEARRRMERLRREGHGAFETVDVLVVPTVPVLPTPIAATSADDGPRIRNVAPFNLAGFPAITVPCGFSTSGLPIGLQLVAPPWREELLFSVAAAYENATTWHRQRPSPRGI
jgi:aspartyl-tRNA(Asn)/glutamyl-tRNA(Gln) amidotransferase subunit A